MKISNTYRISPNIMYMTDNNQQGEWYDQKQMLDGSLLVFKRAAKLEKVSCRDMDIFFNGSSRAIFPCDFARTFFRSDVGYAFQGYVATIRQVHRYLHDL